MQYWGHKLDLNALEVAALVSATIPLALATSDKATGTLAIAQVANSAKCLVFANSAQIFVATQLALLAYIC